eukprot:TRINITY_DN1246_c0_g1_i1.p1 TRINITY_DN1246_c0_g1~~TRINITY_DN1246_c0_g1_i1.p1  ORF type:complete len:155 (+),score=11.95 TRINITY_DN1246_c0_g1_i1:107-571(+)
MRSITIAVLIFASYALAHTCLLTPAQRGSLDGFDTVASDNCIRQTGPCGGLKPQSPSVYIQSNSTFIFTFIKNLDHWYAADPGNFTLRIQESPSSQWTLLGTTPDTESPSLTLFTIAAQLPANPAKIAVVQLVYYPNNPEAPSAFYQCADVGLF